MKIKQMGQKAVLWLYLLCFASIFVQIWIFNNNYAYSPSLQLLLMAAWLGVMGVLCLWAQHGGWLAFLCRHSRKVLLGVLLFVFCMQFAVGLATRQDLNLDYGNLANSAMLYAQQGASESFEAYRYSINTWSNNAGEFIVLVGLFKAMLWMGSTDLYGGMILLGHLFFTVAIACTFFYAEKVCNTHAALATLVFWMCFLMVYVQSSAAYTDTYSIWAPPFALLCWQNSKTAKATWHRVGLWAATVCGVVIGAQIKGSVWVVGVAILCECVLQCNWRQVACFVGVCLVMGALLLTGCNKLYYATVLDEAMMDRYNMPVTHWLMLGLYGPNGDYESGSGGQLSLQGETKAEKVQLNIGEIKRLLQSRTPLETLQFWRNKTTLTFGCANAGIDYMLRRGPHHPEHLIYQFVLEEGRWYRVADKLVQCQYLLFYVFGLLGAVCTLRKKQSTVLSGTALYLALFGFYWFMLLWESNNRQLVNQWPLLIAAAGIGVGLLPWGSQKEHQT